MSDQAAELRPGCFLCEPEPEWTWLESPGFHAVLGLGPIGLGYTLIAAKAHVPSMLDLDRDAAEELADFTAVVRERLRPFGDGALITEHGRVAACVAAAVGRHEAHCMHAHRLVFPGQGPVDLARWAPAIDIQVHPSALDARRSFAWPGQYLYVEKPDGSSQVGAVSGPLPRQFLRAVVAAERGQPALADWRSSPRRHELDLARRILDGALAPQLT